MDIIESLLTGWEKRLKSSLGEYCQIECNAQGNKAFVSRDGGLISVIRIHGALSLSTDNSNVSNSKLLDKRLRSSFKKEGFYVSVVYEKDKAIGPKIAKQTYDGIRNTAKRIGLDCAELLQDSENFIAERIIPEISYLVIQTTPGILSRSQRQRANDERYNKAKIGIKPGQNGQSPDVLMTSLIKQHKGFLSSVYSNLSTILHISMVDCYASLGSIKQMVYRAPNLNWKPRLVGDPVDIRLNIEAIPSRDVSNFMTPSISRQIFNYPVIENHEDATLVDIGNYTAAPLYILCSPQNPTRFNDLLAALPDELPFRVCFDIQTGSKVAKKVLSSRKSSAGFARLFNEESKYIFEACKNLITAGEKGKTIIIQTIVFSTWGKTKVDALENREILIRAIESWGSTTPEIELGDPIGAFLSTIPMFHDRSVGNKLPSDLERAFKLLPFERPGSPFTSGSMLLRTIDSNPWLLELGSSKQAFWSYLIVALPGAGKSALACRIMLSVLLSPINQSMPFIRGIDIGNTFGYWADSIQALLNKDVQHMVQRYKLINDKTQQYNVFDTPLGLREPLSMHAGFLTSFLSLLLTPAGDSPNSDITGALPTIIEELYRYRSETQPKPFSPGQKNIDSALEAINFIVDHSTTWWGVVDALFDAGKMTEANNAQRYASPTLNDIVLILQEVPSLKDRYSGVLIHQNPFIDFISRRLAESMKAYRNLSGATNMDISNARIILLDLMDVAPDPKGDPIAAKQTSVYFMLADQILTRDLFINEENLKTIFDPAYNAYHSEQFKIMQGALKIKLNDEFHRTDGVVQPRANFKRQQREGRKFKFFPLAISQDLNTFDDEMIEFSSNVMLMNVPTEPKKQKDYHNRLGIPLDILEEATRYVLGVPNHNGSSMLMKSKFGESDMFQVLYNTQPPQELWMNVTTMEDVQLKNHVANKIGLDKALSLLGKSFGPDQGFSAKSYINAIRAERSSNAMDMDDSIVFEQILNEMMYS